MPDTFGYPQQTPQSPSTGLFHDRERPIRRPLAHRLDEFPAGYSSADCSPAGSASASPTVDHFALMSSRRSILFCRTVNSVLTVCLSSGDQPKPVLTALQDLPTNSAVVQNQALAPVQVSEVEAVAALTVEQKRTLWIRTLEHLFAEALQGLE